MTDAAPERVEHAGPECVAARCPICGIDGEQAVHHAREMMFGTREPFDYLECPACGTLRIAAIPTDLDRHYPATYYAASAAEPGLDARAASGAGQGRGTMPGPRFAWRWINRLRIRAALGGAGSRYPALARRIDRWGGIPRDGRALIPTLRQAGIRDVDAPILEVGTGRRADRLVALRGLGFRDLLGIEPFVAADFTDRGVPVRRGTIETLEGEGRFALVMLHHVFEHVPDPRATLVAAHRLLRPGGVCLIRTPLADGQLWARYGVDWYELDAPRHLFVFTRRSLAILAGQTGFRVESEVDDSTEVDFIASEQYRRDIPLYAAGSWWVDRDRASLAPEQVAAWRAEAERMNAAGTAGRGGLFLRRV